MLSTAPMILGGHSDIFLDLEETRAVGGGHRRRVVRFTSEIGASVSKRKTQSPVPNWDNEAAHRESCYAFRLAAYSGTK